MRFCHSAVARSTTLNHSLVASRAFSSPMLSFLLDNTVLCVWSGVTVCLLKVCVKMVVETSRAITFLQRCASVNKYLPEVLMQTERFQCYLEIESDNHFTQCNCSLTDFRVLSIVAKIHNRFGKC